eukprot:13919956-Heterocapsa_arctica.AAC.1
MGFARVAAFDALAENEAVRKAYSDSFKTLVDASVSEDVESGPRLEHILYWSKWLVEEVSTTDPPEASQECPQADSNGPSSPNNNRSNSLSVAP